MNFAETIAELEKKYSPLSDECKQALIAQSNITDYKIGDIVVREGMHAKKAYLIVSGCARSYYLRNGKDITDWFTFKNQFMAAIVSFFSDDPSQHYIEFLEESTVLEFSRNIIESLKNDYHDFERFMSKIVTETMLGLCERLAALQFRKAEERYQNLLIVYLKIEQRVPLTHIASFLGITLETLSRVRSIKDRI